MEKYFAQIWTELKDGSYRNEISKEVLTAEQFAELRTKNLGEDVAFFISKVN